MNTIHLQKNYTQNFNLLKLGYALATYHPVKLVTVSIAPTLDGAGSGAVVFDFTIEDYTGSFVII